MYIVSHPTEKRPTTTPPRRRPADDITFDDDDVLGGMGLDSPRETKSAEGRGSGSAGRGRGQGEDEAPRSGGAKSILDDLLGGSSVKTQLEKPGTGSERREFVLDKKYIKSEPGQPQSKTDLK